MVRRGEAGPRRLLISLGLTDVGGVLSVDLTNRRVTPRLVRSALVHGVLPLPGGLAIGTNGEAHTASLFDGATGSVLATLPTGEEPDAIVFEPYSALAVVTNEGSHDLTLIDPVARRVVGTIRLPGKPEYPAAGRDGVLFDNIENRNEIAVIDMLSRRVLRAYPLPGCQAPTGLAYDMADDLLLAVCRNGAAVFLTGRDGRLVKTFDVGNGPDAALFDVVRHRAYVPAGGAGTLTVFSVKAQTVAVQQTLVTAPGSRTAVLDPDSGDLFVPAARFSPPANPHARPEPIPGSFELLVVRAQP